MIISSEIENVEKSGKFGEAAGKIEKSILRAFARTQAKNIYLTCVLLDSSAFQIEFRSYVQNSE